LTERQAGSIPVPGDELMLALDDERPAFTRLTAAERLAWVDFLTTAIAELTLKVGGEYEDGILNSLLEINQMLQVTREDLAMVDDAWSRAIIARVQDVISTLRIRFERECSFVSRFHPTLHFIATLPGR